MVQQYKRQPRVIVKCETEANKVILVGQDGVGKDAAMMEDILQVFRHILHLHFCIANILILFIRHQQVLVPYSDHNALSCL